ncbi:MAG: hypothetical protein GY830_09970, partial [Bacteroidetes bacterium]|nr:hypothetical protein [Bacteroidota bacterium]
MRIIFQKINFRYVFVFLLIHCNNLQGKKNIKKSFSESNCYNISSNKSFNLSKTGTLNKLLKYIVLPSIFIQKTNCSPIPTNSPSPSPTMDSGNICLTYEFDFSFGEQNLTNPQDLIFTNGSIYVTDRDQNDITVFDKDGNFKFNFSPPQNQLSSILGIAADKNLILVAGVKSPPSRGVVFIFDNFGNIINSYEGTTNDQAFIDVDVSIEQNVYYIVPDRKLLIFNILASNFYYQNRFSHFISTYFISDRYRLYFFYNIL